MSSDFEKEIEDDRIILESFRQASRQAFETALNSGMPVTIVENGMIIQLQKVGSRIERRLIREIDP